MTTDARFSEAQSQVMNLKQRPDNETLLELYALYKQATQGDIQGKRPGLLDPKGRAKYDAWARVRGTAPDEAKTRYVALVDRLTRAAG